jgi:mannose-6-phosphate isomerase-like protein (cupin superfamily)
MTTAQIVDKPWGKEIILTTPELPYVGKIIHINAGKKWSTQIHDKKLETFCCVNGQALLVTGPDIEHLHEEIMVENQGYTIQTGTVHYIKGITDVIIFEVSTPEIGTTFRLQDDYGRPDETEEVRNSPNRGWTQK